MTAEYARTEWDRALEALRAAALLSNHAGFDSAASRAYYAVFHAASALFALEGRTFTKHSALEAAVHRDLVMTGRWPTDLGRDFSFCLDVRSVGDYGSEVRVDEPGEGGDRRRPPYSRGGQKCPAGRVSGGAGYVTSHGRSPRPARPETQRDTLHESVRKQERADGGDGE